MDPKQTPPQVGVSSNNMGDSATGKSVFANSGAAGSAISPATGSATSKSPFANAPNRFKDTNPKGDIIIPPSTPSSAGSGRSRKPMIIAIVAAVVVIAVIVVLAIVSSGRFSKPSTSSGDEIAADVSVDVAEAFNKYANFIISGEASTDRMPSEDELDSYYIVDAITNHDSEVLDQAKEYFDTFYNAVEQSGTSATELYGAAEEYKQLFDFIYIYGTTKPLSAEKLETELKKNGKDAVYAEIDNRYKDLLDMTENPDIVAYANAEITYEKAVVDGADEGALLDLEMNVDNVVGTKISDLFFDCYDIDYYLYDFDPDEEFEGEPEEETDTEEDEEGTEE